jgi:hypothetical protein
MGWVSTAVMIQTMAFLLLNLGNSIGAMVLSPFCLIFLAYSLYTYCWRSYFIAKRKDVSYHDTCGPSFLVIILMVAVTLSYVIVFVPEFRRNYSILNDPTNGCTLMSNQLNFTSPTGIIKKDEKIFISSSYSILKLENDKFEKYLIPNIDIQAITMKDDQLYVGYQKPKNSIAKFDPNHLNFTKLFDIDSFLGGNQPILEGLTYSKDEDIFYATSIDGIIGLRIIENSGDKNMIQAVKKIQSTNYLGHLKLDSHVDNYDRISDISIAGEHIFILFKNIHKMIALNLNGYVEAVYPLPATERLWQGISVEKKNKDLFVLHLASDSPSQIWKFNFNMRETYGFQKCAWN